jgi:hypothetical protein
VVKEGEKRAVGDAERTLAQALGSRVASVALRLSAGGG